MILAFNEQTPKPQIEFLEKALNAFCVVQPYLPKAKIETNSAHIIFFNSIEFIKNNIIPPSMRLVFCPTAPSEITNNISALNNISIWNMAQTNQDAIRILYSFIYPEKSLGAAGLTEKGSTIYIEKIQDIACLGRCLDHITSFIQEHNLAIKDRAYDIHQTLSAIVHASIQSEAALGADYPTCDLQVTIADKRLAFSTRHRNNSQRQIELQQSIHTNKKSLWDQATKSSDDLIITNAANGETEVRGVIQNEKKEFSSILISNIEKLNNYRTLVAPKNYVGALISDLPLQRIQKTIFQMSIDQTNSENNNSETHRIVLEKTIQEKNQFAESLLQKDSQLKNLMSSLNKVKLELTATKNKVIKLTKEKSMADRNAAQGDSEKSASNNNSNNALTESKALLLNEINEKRALKNELEKQKNAATQHQKRIAQVEQKLILLSKELANKESQINQLRTEKSKGGENNIKVDSKTESKDIRNEQTQIKTLQLRIRDLENHEQNYKQEIRRLTFKIENSKKSADAQSGGANDKVKLMEKKLEESKQKEIELLKKIELLSASIKKMSRAA